MRIQIPVLGIFIVGHAKAFQGKTEEQIRAPADYTFPQLFYLRPQTEWDDDDCTMYINGDLALARCPTSLHYWKGDRFFKFKKEEDEDSEYHTTHLDIHRFDIGFFSKFQSGYRERGFQFLYKTNCSEPKWYVIYSDGSDDDKAGEELIYSMRELSDNMLQNWDLEMEIIDRSLVYQTKPNSISAILVDEEQEKVDEAPDQENLAVNTEEEMERYQSSATRFVRLWPYYESNFFVQHKAWQGRNVWSTKEYTLEPLGQGANQQHISYVRTLNFPNVKYNSMYANGYDMIIFTYTDKDNDYHNDKDVEVLQVYQCYSEGSDCKLHYEYSIEDDPSKDKEFTNRFVTWERSSDLHEVMFLTRSKETDAFFLNYLRFYMRFDDPIIFEIKEIPLYQHPRWPPWGSLYQFPKYISEYQGNFLLQVDGENTVYMMNLCDFDEYFDRKHNSCRKCQKQQYNWDPQGERSSCRWCRELAGKWAATRITRYLGETICWDAKYGEDTYAAKEPSSNCLVFCGEGQGWVWPAIIGGVIALATLLACLNKPDTAARNRSFREEAQNLLLVIV